MFTKTKKQIMQDYCKSKAYCAECDFASNCLEALYDVPLVNYLKTATKKEINNIYKEFRNEVHRIHN